MINRKHLLYNKDEITNVNVNHLMNNIYNEKKDNATKIFTNLIESDKEYERNLIKRNDITFEDSKKLKGF
jgi:hypothetical protein